MNDAGCSSISCGCNVGNNNRASEYMNYKSFYGAQCGPSEVCAKFWTSKSFTTEQTSKALRKIKLQQQHHETTKDTSELMRFQFSSCLLK